MRNALSTSFVLVTTLTGTLSGVLAGCTDEDSQAPSAPIVTTVDSLQLPYSPPFGFYPTAIASSADGTMFVTGIAGAIVKYVPTSLEAQVIVQPVNPSVIPPGLIVDDRTKTLWVCGNIFDDFTKLAGPHPAVYAYDFDGKPKSPALYPLPPVAPGANLGTCADLTLDPTGGLLITDQFSGAIFQLASPIGAGSTVKLWSADPLLAPAYKKPPEGPYTPPFGGKGITVNGNSLYVSNFYNAELIKIALKSDGTAGAAVRMKLQGKITNPSALRTIDATHMLVVDDSWEQPSHIAEDGTVSGPLLDQPGAVDELELTSTEGGVETWTVIPLRNGIKGPSGLTVANGSLWVTEGQAAPLIDSFIYYAPGALEVKPVLPFRVYRVEL
jgi:hypothetical protein